MVLANRPYEGGVDLNETRFLIVGGDGLIGAALGEAIVSKNGIATCTSMRREAPEGALFLDLLDQASVDALDASRFDIAYICAGLSTYADVDANPSASRLINVTNTLRLCDRLLDAGCSVVFLSTAAVFDGESHCPDEASPVSPGTLYGRQKAEVEALLMDRGRTAQGRVKIVRLTKVMAANMPLIRGWRNSLARGQVITPFMDLQLSPVSLGYVVNSLLKIGLIGHSGIFHLSGNRDVTYAEIANELSLHWGYSPGLISAISSTNSGVFLSYKPKFPSLGMTMTSKLAGISPQLFDDCIADLTDCELINCAAC